MVKECPQCKKEMKKIKFDIGYGIEVDSLHCEECGFNITNDKILGKAITELNEQMAKEVKVIEVGTGLGIRFPNEMVKTFKLRKGEEILVKPEHDGLKLIPA